MKAVKIGQRKLKIADSPLNPASNLVQKADLQTAHNVGLVGWQKGTLEECKVMLGESS